MIDKAHNYEEIDKINYKKRNNYNELKDKAIDYIDRKKRINNIYNYLLKDSSKLNDVDTLVCEENNEEPE